MTHTLALTRGAPEAQGIPSAAILAFVQAAEREVDHLHSLMLLRHGRVVAEGWWAPYTPSAPHMLFSLSKSFTATAIGLAVAEGRLTVDDRVLDFFPAERPANVSPRLAAMRVHDLLAMATGHAEDTTPALRQAADGNWVRAFLAQPVEHPPGTFFVYNSGATYMLAAILQHLTGQTLVDYLQPRLYGPLGIEGVSWEVCPRGINTGGWGMKARTEDIARFGQLYLQAGRWEGRQLVPAAWVTAATSIQSDNSSRTDPDWAQGYGYQLWRCRHGAYRGDGAFGQFCVVMPEQQTVLAITGGLPAMQPVLDLVWRYLRPALGPAPLPDDTAAAATLAHYLERLQLTPPGGAADSPLAAAVAGATYRLAANELGLAALQLMTDAQGWRLTVRDASGEHLLSGAYGRWQTGQTSLGVAARSPVLFAAVQSPPVAASGGWATDDTFVATVCFVETPFVLTLTLRFVGPELTLTPRLNVSFGPTELAPVHGRRQ